jgi:bifunctional UDP-N-acetylglucosamine pyrophosphorylase/glucosamine-1-phosphate N-acetyltransferase
MKRLVVVLAAGQGTRMKSPRAKVLHPVLGRPMVVHLLESLAALAADRTLVVVGHQGEAARAAVSPFDVLCVVQEPQLGTGHALMACRAALEAEGPAEVLLVPGDAPLLPGELLAGMWETFHRSGEVAAVVTLRLEKPSGYGRIVRDGASLARIVEERDASAEERALTEVNSGVYFFRSPDLWGLLERIGRDNAQGEYYLTDLFALLHRQGRSASLYPAADAQRWLGINTQEELAQSTDRLRVQVVRRWMAAGVTVMDPASTWIEPAVALGAGVVLHPFVRLCGSTRLGDGVEVRSFSVLNDCEVGEATLVKEYCVIEKTSVGPRCILGPFTRTREGTVLEEEVHLGNFVETKKARLGRGVKANHLSYLGDASVGAGSNIGAGTITCNYDGRKKHQTLLGEGVFVGSDTQLVAPVTVGDGAYIGAGATITKDVPAGALALSRVPQKIVEGWAQRKKSRDP